ncbi:hypothetical protein PWF77_09670 [Streptococcus suis]|nr:hypothetical protein [Streptococcus suis]MDE1701096.1 hypothetical protein [Streptococcus suis]
MNETRFLELFNDLDKVLRKVCGVADGEYADVGSLYVDQSKGIDAT